jgi:putative transposase
MFVCFLYLAVRALFGLLVRSRRGPDVKDVELMVLRHELAVLRRQVGRPKLRPADRVLLAAAVCHLPRSSPRTLLVTPRTLLRRHQALCTAVALGGPPAGAATSPEIRELVLRLARENHAGAIGGSAASWPSLACYASPTSIRRLLVRAPAGTRAATVRCKLARLRARAGGGHRGA